MPFTMRGNAKAMRRIESSARVAGGKSKRRSNSARVVMGLPELDETRGYGVPMSATCTECRGHTEHGEIKKTPARTRPNR